MNMYGGTGGRCCFKGAVCVIRNVCPSPQLQLPVSYGKVVGVGRGEGEVHAWMYGIDLKQHGVGCQSDRRGSLAIRR